jgi:hypothetical protein
MDIDGCTGLYPHTPTITATWTMTLPKTSATTTVLTSAPMRAKFLRIVREMVASGYGLPTLALRCLTWKTMWRPLSAVRAVT